MRYFPLAVVEVSILTVKNRLNRLNWRRVQNFSEINWREILFHISLMDIYKRLSCCSCYLMLFLFSGEVFLVIIVINLFEALVNMKRNSNLVLLKAWKLDLEVELWILVSSEIKYWRFRRGYAIMIADFKCKLSFFFNMMKSLVSFNKDEYLLFAWIVYCIDNFKCSRITSYGRYNDSTSCYYFKQEVMLKMLKVWLSFY